MTDGRDPLDVIRAYRPPIEDGYDDVLARVFDTAPDERATSRRPGARLRAAVALTALTLALAVGAAGAAGVTPHSAWKSIFDSPGSPAGAQYRADPETARKVFVIPGPGGSEFAAWTIENKVGWKCVSDFFEPRGTTEFPVQRFTESAGGCALTSHADRGLFGDGSAQSTFEHPGNRRVSFVYPAGDAARAKLVVTGGADYPVPVRNGWLGGWFSLTQVPRGSSATVVAYGRDGNVLGHRVVLDQAGCDDPRGC